MKRDPYLEYWIECVAQSLDEHGVQASQEQIEAISKDIKNGHEMYGEAFGHHFIPNPLAAENKRLAAEVVKEREKVICKECKGKGHIISYGSGTLMSESQCWKCRGDGRHSP